MISESTRTTLRALRGLPREVKAVGSAQGKRPRGGRPNPCAEHPVTESRWIDCKLWHRGKPRDGRGGAGSTR